MKRLFLQPGRLRSSLVIALLSLLLAACSTSNSDRLYLTDWSLSWHLNDYPATVPGFIHTDLMANGLIDDPYYGTNEDSARWVEDREWRYRCHIDRNRLPKGDTLWLVFEGLAGRTNVILYGQRVKNMTGEIEEMYTTDNMFVQYTFPLPPDCEDIEVVFLPLDDSLREASYGIPLPDRRAFTRIAPYQQGWDWGPKLPTCGIWKPVYITNKAKREISKSELKTLKSSSIKASSFKVELCQKADSIGQSFTFYKDGKPIDGATQSYLFVDGGLDFSANYSAEVTRKDGQKLMTCDFTPTKVQKVSNIPSLMPLGSTIKVPGMGKARWFSPLGLSVSEQDYNDSYIVTPQAAGTFLLQLAPQDGKTAAHTYRVVIY